MAKTEEFELSLDHLGLKKPSQVSKPELMVFYGNAGSGKSYLSATASWVPELAPILILDTEGSTAGTVAAFDDESIDILPINSTDELDQIIEALTTKTHKYKTVVIDTFDVAQERAADDFVEANPGNKFQGWAEVKEWTIDIARTLKAADFLSIMVFHENVEKSDTGAMVSKLVLKGSAKDTMPGIPDVVGLVSRKADKEGVETTSVQFAPDPNKATKNRFRLPATLEDPTVAKILEYAEQNAKENK